MWSAPDELFCSVLETGDSSEDIVVVLSAADPDGTSVTELDDKTTGDPAVSAYGAKHLP